jgi:hypothetical protein
MLAPPSIVITRALRSCITGLKFQCFVMFSENEPHVTMPVYCVESARIR